MRVFSVDCVFYQVISVGRASRVCNEQRTRSPLGCPLESNDTYLFLVRGFQLLKGDGAEDAVGHHQADHHEVGEHHGAQAPRVVQHLRIFSCSGIQGG